MRQILKSAFSVNVLASMALALGGCAGSARLSVDDGTGANPRLPAPNTSLIPTMKIAKAVGWSSGAMPTPAAGLSVNAFAQGLDHPRWLYVLPNGDVLVAETNAPPRPDDSKGIKGWIASKIIVRAGANAPSANRITLLRDSNGDGVADKRSVLLSHLNFPFGMALVGDWLYVAETDALLRFPYRAGETVITAAAQKVMDLPAGPIDHHWTKNIIASPDGRMLYIIVGSNSNVGENGLAAEQGRARILQLDLASGKVRAYATGLRNPNGMGWQPQTGALWVAVTSVTSWAAIWCATT